MDNLTPERLTELRKTFGLTQGELASRLQLDGGTLSRWERGKQSIPGMVRYALVGMATVPVIEEHLTGDPEGNFTLSIQLIDELAKLRDIARIAGVGNA